MGDGRVQEAATKVAKILCAVLFAMGRGGFARSWQTERGKDSVETNGCIIDDSGADDVQRRTYFSGQGLGSQFEDKQWEQMDDGEGEGLRLG